MKSEAIKQLYANLPKSADVVDSSPNQEESAMQVDGIKLLSDFVEMVRCIAIKASFRIKSPSVVTYGTKTLPFDVVDFAG